MRYLVVILLLVFAPKAFACGTNENENETKEFVFVEQTDETSYCKYLSIYFRKQIPSRPLWIWTDPLPMLKIVKDDESAIEVRLYVRNSERQDYLEAGLCLSDEFIRESVLTITYRERMAGKPITQISFCIEEIVIDNLEELLLQTAQEK